MMTFQLSVRLSTAMASRGKMGRWHSSQNRSGSVMTDAIVG